jgi:KDO2-lipid IV(A) lauroyltransferase
VSVSRIAVLGSNVGFYALHVLARLIPVGWLYGLGRGAAWLLLRTLPRLRRDLHANATRILGPDASIAARDRLARRVLESFSRFAIEVVTADQRLPADASLFGRMKGREHFECAREQSKGIIGVTLHMGNYEAGALLLTRIIRPVAIVYSRDRTGIFERIRSSRRRQHEIAEIPVDASALFGITALDFLRQRGMVLLAGDLGFDDGRDILEVAFLGYPAPFLVWPARLALASGAPLLPCFVIRGPEGEYHLEVAPPVWPAAGDSAEKLLERLIPVFEEYVRRYPEQWLIIHRYWRTAPAAGET